MKVWFFILGMMFMNTLVSAQEISVNWSCPADAQGLPVSVFYDDGGKLEFNPDPFAGNFKRKPNVDYSDCLKEFQRRIDSAVAKFKAEKCATTPGPLCSASKDYTNNKVTDKLKASRFVSANSDITVGDVSTAQAVVTPKIETVSKPVQPITSPEAYLEKLVSDKIIDPANLSQTFRFQNKTYKVSDFDRVISNNIGNVFSRMNAEDKKQYAQNYMLAKSEYLNSDNHPAKRKEVMDNLNLMFANIYGDKGPEELQKMLECEPEDDLTPIVAILNNVNQSNKVKKCDPLKAGEHKVFEQERSDYYGTGSYLLRKKANGNYEAVLNLRFQSGEGSVAPNEMMKRTKSCMNVASNFMKGPNGEKLQIAIMDQSEINQLPSDQRPGMREISIEKPNFQTHALGYAETIDCPTITHEILHLLGLCDEYKEDRAQFAGMWECRVVTSAPSIMRETTRTFNRVMGQGVKCNCSTPTCKSIMNSKDENLKKMYVAESLYDLTNAQFRSRYCTERAANSNEITSSSPDKQVTFTSDRGNSFTLEARDFYSMSVAPYYAIGRKIITCNCPTGDQACLSEKEKYKTAFQNSGTRKFCPAGTTLIDYSNEIPRTVLSATEISLAPQPSGESLLQPNQFKKILAGNCRGIVDGYLECAEYAYKSLKDGPCNVPERCRDDSYYLGTKQ